MSLSAGFAVGAILLVVLVLAGIALYLLFAFGLYKLAEREKVEYSWLAFIPIAQFYIVGKLVKEIKLFNYVVPRHELVLPGGLLAYLIVSKVPVLGFLIWLASTVLVVAALYYLFKRYKGTSSLGMNIVSIILFPIFVFLMRDRVPQDANQNVPV